MTRQSRHQAKTLTVQEPDRSQQPAARLVPSRRQYLELKAGHPNALLLYRMGDFYEAFDDDARAVARDARITLTSRSLGRSGRVPMAGIPHHALNHYLSRLLAAGHTIAIADQLSEPGRGLVERAVTRVLTPGTVGDPALLPATENRYLAAVAALGNRLGLSWVDVSTGEFAAMEVDGYDDAGCLSDELARLNPAECLVPDHSGPHDVVDVDFSGHRTRLEAWHFDPQRAGDALREHFKCPSLAPFGCDGLPAATAAAGAIVAYLRRTNAALLPLLTGLRTESSHARCGLDAATRRNLELTRGLRTGGTRGSLLGVLDRTRTAMGARTLRRMVGQPLRDLNELHRRREVVGALVTLPPTRATLGEYLRMVGDLERSIGRVAHGTAAARDFLTLSRALHVVPELLAALRGRGSAPLTAFAGAVDGCEDVWQVIDAGVVEDEEGVARVRAGYFPPLDAAHAGIRDTRRWLAALESRERERTGIRSLKVGYNKVFGYYIEVTRPNLSLVPADYLRKQTVATGERFVTSELKDAETRILAAEDEITSLEREALRHLGMSVAASTSRLLETARRLAELDALLSFAEVADRHSWTKPVLADGDELVIEGGRHPVVEASLAGDPFIPNDCHLGGEGPCVLLVTGPNMGGKSTFLRQVGLIVLLAQIGSFVPARKARIGLVDRIFTRVGAHDDLAGGASTFMVEMLETATILRQATDRSLVILDEVGRGTGTADGIAIARAVLEDIHDRIGARTLFATHYLELTALATSLPGMANSHVAVLEADGRVIFLYALRPGAADRSYGIQVARLAGLPPWVAARAEEVLGMTACARDPEAESEWRGGDVRTAGTRTAEAPSSPYQLALDGFDPGLAVDLQIARELRSLDLTAMTPREAADWLFEQQARLGGRP